MEVFERLLTEKDVELSRASTLKSLFSQIINEQEDKA
jgi:hypothetical protein